MSPSAAAPRVLVVDDDPFVRELIASILQGGGYGVSTAGNGAEAAALFTAAGDVDLIVSDMNMPEMDGLGLIRSIRSTGADVPIIILTGNNEVTTAIQALKLGANDYLLKDENIQDTICIAAEKVLEKHHLVEQNRRLMADLADKNQRLEGEKAFAQKVQEHILPRDLRFPGLEVATTYRPSDKIGGDFFDAWEDGGRVHFLIGDASGHSTSSALVMAASRGVLHSLGHALRDPREIVKAANGMICSIVSDSGLFLTLLYGVFDRAREELEIVSAGHNPVFLVRDNGIERIESTGAVVGWDAEDCWQARTTPFPPGSSLVLYTDGLIEVRNREGVEYGEAALESLLIGNAPPNEVIRKVLQSVESFCAGEFTDDLTLFVMQRARIVGDAAWSLRLPTTFASVDTIRVAVQKFCQDRWRDPESAVPQRDVTLAVVEAMNNVVEHSGAAEMEIDVESRGGALVFRMRTAGALFDPTTGRPFPDLDAAKGLPEGGFGLPLIATLADRVSYDYLEGKNILTLEKVFTKEVSGGDEQRT